MIANNRQYNFTSGKNSLKTLNFLDFTEIQYSEIIYAILLIPS